MQADIIRIETDEDGFHLVIVNAGPLENENFDFLIERPEALHEQVNLIIGSWLAEGQAVRAEVLRYTARDFTCAPEDIDESGGYALSDPKHENFHSVHADIYDNREKV